jgi:hypothetical protein
MRKFTKIKLQLSIIALLFLQIGVFAQNQPLNSNYLIENGISPRVLDAAASSFMQDGRFIENVVVNIKNDEGKKTYDKKKAIKERDILRDAQRELRNR